MLFLLSHGCLLVLVIQSQFRLWQGTGPPSASIGYYRHASNSFPTPCCISDVTRAPCFSFPPDRLVILGPVVKSRFAILQISIEVVRECDRQGFQGNVLQYSEEFDQQQPTYSYFIMCVHFFAVHLSCLPWGGSSASDLSNPLSDAVSILFA